MTVVQSQAPASAPPAWQPDPNRQGHYTADDVLSLPDHAPRVQLRDGVITAVPSPTLGHQTIAALLWTWLRNNAPPGMYEPGLAVGVLIDDRNTIEPDVLLLARPVDPGRHFFLARQVVLAVEVVSPSTQRRDRVDKLNRCAAARIPHYWLVERAPAGPRLAAYALDGDGTYTLVAEADTLLELASPFPITLRLKDIQA